jgi:hypothetical protein
MKLPYRVGETFTMPIGDGSVVEATIVAHDHHTVDIAVSDLVLRVWDSALVLHRWKTVRPTYGRSRILRSEPSPASCGYSKSGPEFDSGLFVFRRWSWKSNRPISAQ